MENAEKGPQTALDTVRAIKGGSPLAEGFTVNIADATNLFIDSPAANEAVAAGRPWRLRVWNAGRPVEDSYHARAQDAAMRLGALVMAGTVGARLKNEAMRGMADLMGGRS